MFINTHYPLWEAPPLSPSNRTPIFDSTPTCRLYKRKPSRADTHFSSIYLLSDGIELPLSTKFKHCTHKEIQLSFTNSRGNNRQTVIILSL